MVDTYHHKVNQCNGELRYVRILDACHKENSPILRQLVCG
nr:MAG TPA: hypothetical protein [Caudoviricetes sp.]